MGIGSKIFQQNSKDYSLITNKIVFLKRENQKNQLICPNLRKFSESGSLFLKLRHFCELYKALVTFFLFILFFFFTFFFLKKPKTTEFFLSSCQNLFFYIGKIIV